MSDKIVLALSTFPDRETAQRIATQLVTEKFAACANILPAIESIYRWQGQVEQSDEELLIIKTRKDLFGALEKRVRELHSYDVPEIIATPITGGSAEYLSWLENETRT